MLRAPIPSNRCSRCSRPLNEGFTICPLCENKDKRDAAPPFDNTYRGETGAKRLSRYRCYDAVARRFLSFGFPRDGWAICLAGPEAPEVGLLKHCLAWPRDRVLFVDRDPDALREAERRWPGVDTFYGDVTEAIDYLPNGIAFAHFDFLGHMNTTVQTAMEIAGHQALENAIIMYTYFRGREKSGKTPMWELAERYTKRAMGRGMKAKRRFRSAAKSDRMEATRSFGYMAVGIDLLSKRCQGIPFVPVFFGANYHSGSPMGTFAAQRYSTARRRSDKYKQLERDWEAIGDEMRQRVKHPDLAIKQLSSILRKNGLDTEQIGALFNVPPRTVAAWLAHATRGTYAKPRTWKRRRRRG